NRFGLPYVGFENLYRDLELTKLLGRLLRIAAIGTVGVIEEIDDAGGARAGEGFENDRSHAARAAGDQHHLPWKAIADHCCRTELFRSLRASRRERNKFRSTQVTYWDRVSARSCRRSSRCRDW